MTISIWRYSHWILAITTSLFVLVASITGIVLAVEPISNQLQPYAVTNSSTISITELLTSLNTQFEEVISIEVDDHQFLKASVVTKEGQSQSVYINPENAQALNKLNKRTPIFEFATNLHRSLFLKSTGRFLIGLVSFLMILISITGIMLIAKRQGGYKRWFSKVVNEGFNQYFHVVLGRYFLVPILIIAVTGVMLSLHRFSVLPESKSVPTFYETKTVLKAIDIKDFKLFKSTKIKDLVSLEFPFSDDEEDYFALKLKDEEYNINQYSGQVLMKAQTPVLKQLLNWSFALHTGQGSMVWAFVLLCSCIAILFFMYSGFAMALQRLKSNTAFKNKYHYNTAEYIILVGSETGSTFKFAQAFAQALLKSGQSVFLDEMNNYQSYPKAKHLLIFTATYGEGDAPSGATKFANKFKTIQQSQNIKYSVIGFGSLHYPEFCKYAIETEELLYNESRYHQLLPLVKINNQSVDQFKKWIQQWSAQVKLDLDLDVSTILQLPRDLKSFKVVSKSNLNIDDTFTLQLQAPKDINFQSGDLFAIYPKADKVERLYSIGKVDNLITLSIKRHDFGVGSNALYALKVGNSIKAKVKVNSDFHLPNINAPVLFIANGTGIAPFLGMLHKYYSQDRYLFWGGRTTNSIELYKPYLNQCQFTDIQVALSQEYEKKVYVHDLLEQQQELILELIKRNGVIMICGSLKMYSDVCHSLDDVLQKSVNQSVEKLIETSRLKADCY